MEDDAVSVDILRKIRLIIKDPLAIVTRAGKWILHEDKYVVRVSIDMKEIHVHRHYVMYGSANRMPRHIGIPLSDPDCFEKVARVVEKEMM